MQKELIISTTPQETKIAILEDDELVEFYIERHQAQAIVGNIYKGKVTKVLPGMQSAFVNIGLERDAFLYVSDFLEDAEEYETLVSSAEEAATRLEERGATAAAPAALPAPPAPPPPSVTAAAPAAPAAPVVAPAAEVEPVSRTEAAEAEQAPAAVVATGLAANSGFDRKGPRRRDGRERDRDRDRDRDRRGKRPRIPTFEGRSEPAFEPQSYGPLEVLPGETLAKYSPSVRRRDASTPVSETDSAHEASDVTPAAEVSLSEATEGGPVEKQAPAETRSEAPDATPLEATPSGETERSQAESETEPEPASARIVEPPENTRFVRRSPGRRPPRRGGSAPGPGSGAGPGTRPPESRGNDHTSKPSPMISDLLREGQEILVQVAKEPLGKKGARITSHIALPGRYLVYMPTVDHIGVSRKITSEEERSRLKRIIQENRNGLPGGFIVRTAADGRSDEEFLQDLRFLRNLWTDIREKNEKKSGPALIHRDMDLVQRIMRDQLSQEFQAIRIDDEHYYATVLDFVRQFQPSLVNRVKLHVKDTPILEEHGLQQEIDKALRPKIWLKSGGYIVINQTEALVAIDVNTGKFVGKSNRLEDTIVKTNLDAVKELVRQIRLRNLGGIIVVDFIDMEEKKNRQRVMGALEEALRADRAPSKILQFNDFGLVAITRKRTQASLERTVCMPCPHCAGAGWIKSIETLCYEIQQELRKMSPTLDGREITIRVNPEVAKALKSGAFVSLLELEETTRKDIVVKSDPLLHEEHFDIF